MPACRATAEVSAAHRDSASRRAFRAKGQEPAHSGTVAEIVVDAFEDVMGVEHFPQVNAA